METYIEKTSKTLVWAQEMKRRLLSMHSSTVQEMGRLEKLSEEAQGRGEEYEHVFCQQTQPLLLLLRELNEQLREDTSTVLRVERLLCGRDQTVRSKPTKHSTPDSRQLEQW